MNTLVSRCGFALLWACLAVGALTSIVGAFLGAVIGLSWALDINPAVATIGLCLMVLFVMAFVGAWREYGR